MNCLHCNHRLEPSIWQRIPSGHWSVSFTCPNCDNECYVPWRVSAGLMFASTIFAFAFLALVMAIFEDPPAAAVVVGTIGVGYGMFVVALTKYLSQAKNPIVRR